jgi:hypothetical protein
MMPVRRTKPKRTRSRRDRGTGSFNPPSRTQVNPETARIVKEIDKLYSEPKYEVFLEKLGAAAQDPKLKHVLIGGLLDGELLEDVIRHGEIMRMGKNLVPIQHEIDLEASLQWIGKMPDNVPLILRGGTLGPEHFGDNPIITGYGQYIIDGHHRWSQAYLINPEARLKVINLHVEDPEAMLRKSQIAIAAMTGEVPVARVEPGKNLYTMNPEDIRKAIPKYLSPEFYKAFYDTDPDNFKTREDVHEHIYGNVMKLRRHGRPITDIDRSLMPQYDKMGVLEGLETMKAGVVNVKPPYVKKKKPSSDLG